MKKCAGAAENLDAYHGWEKGRERNTNQDGKVSFFLILKSAKDG